MLPLNNIQNLRQSLQNCGSALTATDMKNLLDALEKIENGYNNLLENYVPEAPADGKKYVRCNKAWIELDKLPSTKGGSFDASYDDSFENKK